MGIYEDDTKRRRLRPWQSTALLILMGVAAVGLAGYALVTR